MRILIIKLGYSETLDANIGRVASLGDVLRTTPILWALKKKYPESHISWLVDEQAEPLLRNNHFIDRILIWDSFVPFQLIREKYDILINLEKIPGVCALADMIDAWTKYGFRLDSISGSYHAYEKGLNFIEYIEEKRKSNTARGFWQQVLIEMLGAEWKGQEYIIGYQPGTTEIFDIGFNHEVGSKWPCKAMPEEGWRRLEKNIKDMGYTVSWQRGQNNLFEYMDWINSCHVIVSNDSLGLHLAYALKKKVIGLFGPTDPREVYIYGDGKLIGSSKECPYMPCYNSQCTSGLNCMKSIDVKDITDAINEMLCENYAEKN